MTLRSKPLTGLMGVVVISLASLGSCSESPGRQMQLRDIDLLAAASKGDSLTVNQFIERKRNLDIRMGAYQVSPLMVASMRGRARVVEALLVGGANVNLPDQDGYMAADYAVRGSTFDKSIPNDNREIIDLLKKRNANLKASSRMDLFLFLPSRPIPPECFKDVGETPPCGVRK